MKKLFYSMFALAALAMTNTSCSDELENTSSTNSNEAVVSFNVQLENEVGSRAVGDGTTAKELHYAVYKKDKPAAGVAEKIGHEIAAMRCEGSVTMKDDLTAEVKFTLVKGQTYNFLFWAQCKDGYKYYTIDYTNGTVKVNYKDNAATADENEGRANNEERDAFFKVRKNLTVNGPIQETITLKRPFSQINVGTKIGSLKDAQKAEVWVKKSSFTIKNAANTLDVFTGAATGAEEVKFAMNDIVETNAEDAVGDLKNVDDTDYEYLSMNYFLVADEGNAQVTPVILPGEGKQLINATFEIFGSQTAEGEVDAKAINTFEIPNIPVQRNWRTNIIGDIMNETVTFNIVIDPNFDDDHNYYTEKELAYAFASGGEVTLDKDVYVTAPFYLDADNKVITGKTIVVNLNGKTLHYTGSDIMARLGEGATVTFNGPGMINASHYIASANKGGTIIVNGGQYETAQVTLFQANGGKVYIKDGVFNAFGEYQGKKNLYTLNHMDAEKNNGLIEVSGGRFVGFDPAAAPSENPKMNFVKYGYMSKPNADNTEYEVVENPLEQVSMKGGEYQLDADVNLVRPLKVTKDLVLDLNGKKLENNSVVDDDCTVLIVTDGATLTIKGNGKVHSTGAAGWASAVWANGGVVNIENGDFYNTGKASEGADLIYASNGGKIYVAGGSFKSEYLAVHVTSGNYALLNCKDRDYKSGKASIEVTGGTFYKFNPANNVCEGAGTNYVVDGYASTQNGDNWVVAVKEAVAGETVKLSTDGIIANSVKVNGGTLDGNGYTLTQSEAPVTNNLVHTKGAATIKNLNIVGTKSWNDNGTYRGPRAIFIEQLNGDVIIDNVETSGVCYPLNVNASTSSSESNLIVKNSVLRGWTSYGNGLASATFSNVKFEKGSYDKNGTTVTYAYCRPYVQTRFDGCAFEAGFKVDENINGSTTYPVIEIKNCTLGGVKITDANKAELFETGADLKNVKVIQ